MGTPGNRVSVRRYNVLVPAVNLEPQLKSRLTGQALPISTLPALAVSVMARLHAKLARSRSAHLIPWGAF
jgi:hypothetical protein